MTLLQQAIADLAPEVQAAILKAHEDETAGLKSKTSELLGEIKKLKPLKDVDLDEVASIKNRLAAYEEQKMRAEGDFDSLKKQLLEAHGKEKAALEDKLTKLTKSLEENVLTRLSVEAIAAEKGAAELLMPHIKARTKLDENGNAVVVDDSGAVRVDSSGNPITISALVAELKSNEKYGRAFESTIPSGSGTPNNNGKPAAGAKTITRSDFEPLSQADRANFIKTGGKVVD